MVRKTWCQFVLQMEEFRCALMHAVVRFMFMIEGYFMHVPARWGEFVRYGVFTIYESPALTVELEAHVECMAR